MSEKTLGEWLLEQFEKLETEELQEAKEIAEMVKMTPKLKARSKPKKILEIWNRWKLETLKGQLQVR